MWLKLALPGAVRGSAKRPTTDALCLYFVFCILYFVIYHTILSIPLSILAQSDALDYNNPYHIRLT